MRGTPRGSFVPILVVLGAYVAVAIDREALARSKDLGAWFWIWTITSLLTLAIALWPCFEKPKFRADERHASKSQTRVRLHGSETSAVMCDISVGGVSLQGLGPHSRGDACEVFV